MMRNAFACICLLVAHSLLCAAGQDGERAPGAILEAPPPRAISPPGGSVLLTGPDIESSPPNLEELRENFLKLQEARQLLQQECMLAKGAKHAADAQAPDNAKLKLRLGEILVKLKTQKAKPVLPDTSKPPMPVQQDKKVETPKETASPKQEKTAGPPTAEGPPPVNPTALAQALFKSQNYEGALKAFRLIDLKGTKAEERCPIQYLMAVCLKRTGQREEAATLFREVANARGDENMAACAQWQLGALHWRHELESQLDDVRQRRKMLENQP